MLLCIRNTIKTFRQEDLYFSYTKYKDTCFMGYKIFHSAFFIYFVVDLCCINFSISDINSEYSNLLTIEGMLL